MGRLFDTNVVDPDYKCGTIDPLREHTKCQDDITIVGGGFGVSAVVAAHEGNSVLVYEAGEEYAVLVRETAELNLVTDKIQVEEAVVGRDHDVYGKSVSETVVAPDELEPCDVLEMDCEGAEREILEKMEISPRVVIVETHPDFGVDPDDIRSMLQSRGYEIKSTFLTDNGNVTFASILSTDETDRGA